MGNQDKTIRLDRAEEGAQINEQAALYLERAAWALRRLPAAERKLYAYRVAWGLLSLRQKRSVYKAMSEIEHYKVLADEMINDCYAEQKRPG